MNADGEIIPVVLTPDDAYAAQAGVTMISALRRAKNPQGLHFYLLSEEPGLAPENLRRLTVTVGEFGAALTPLTVTASVLDRIAADTNYLPRNAFVRMLAPELLPRLEKCLYLDCDVVVLDDLALLWREDVSRSAVGAVRDWHVDGRGLMKYRQIKFYFNSGVLLMNLTRWRERDYSRECLRLAARPELTERYSDQDVLNLVFCEDTLPLHPRWNIQTGQNLLCRLHSQRRGDTVWREARDRPGIAHYSGRKRKPWDFDMKHDHALAWWENFQFTPWGKECADLPARLQQAADCDRAARRRRWLRDNFALKVTPSRGIFRLVWWGKTLADVRPKGR
jgi:lipopolysaccharide biosynthesis glycosyltransferase